MRVCDLAGGVLKIVNGFFERFTPGAIVVCHFTKTRLPKYGRYMVEQTAYKHCRGEVAALTVSGIDLLAKPDELLEIKLSGTERAQLAQAGIGYDRQMTPLRCSRLRRSRLRLFHFHPLPSRIPHF